MPSSRILIAGCGDLGMAIAERLVNLRHAVWGLRRNLPPTSPDHEGGGIAEAMACRAASLGGPYDRLRAGPTPTPCLRAGLVKPLESHPFQWIQADLTRPETLVGLPEGWDYVVFSAGADRRDEPAYHALYVQGFSHLIAALHEQRQQPRRILFVSSTSVYGQTKGEWVDETSETRPASFQGQIMLAAEDVLRADALSFEGRGVVLRLGGLYGPGRTQLVERVQSGNAALPSGPPVWTNRIHRDDAAAAIVHLLFLPQVEPVYVGVDHEPTPYHEVIQWLAEKMGITPPPLHPRSKSNDNGSLRDPAKALMRAGNKRCSNARLLATGFTFQYPSFREGYAKMLQNSLCPA